MSFFWNWSHIWKVILALCVRNEKLTQMSTLCFHLHYFCLFVGTRVQLL